MSEETTERTQEMTNPKGVMLAPGGGHRIEGGDIDATTKVTMKQSAYAATFESICPPSYDVGAHVHTEGEEMFYMVEGQLDVLAFEPIDRSIEDWREWESADGDTFLRGGPGSFMYVPVGVPHAFANPSSEPTKIFFQWSMEGGHEEYFEELAALLKRTNSQPSEDDVEKLRQRYDIEQLTPLHDGAHG